jgi:hypothetical protein
MRLKSPPLSIESPHGDFTKHSRTFKSNPSWKLELGKAHSCAPQARTASETTLRTVKSSHSPTTSCKLFNATTSLSRSSLRKEKKFLEEKRHHQSRPSSILIGRANSRYYSYSKALGATITFHNVIGAVYTDVS